MEEGQLKFNLSRRGNSSAPSAERIWNALELLSLLMLLNIGQEGIETALAFFSCFTNRLVTLFSALYCAIHCVCCHVNRYQNSPRFPILSM